MSGKAYTMNEMKRIVDYLVAQSAYEDIRGRKMWMDFANSRLVERTWQSLKETFLKRILPDIHNPYYKLTREQIASFRQGYDVDKRNRSKLEVRTVSEGSSNSAENRGENYKQAGISKNDEERPSGENNQCSKVQPSNRSSTETLVLDNCYENAEEIQRDLESPNKEDEKSQNKSLRDFITYSEPLTPMLQEVIDDFATDDEDNPQLQIVEEVEVVTDNLPIRKSKSLTTGNEDKKVPISLNLNGDESIKDLDNSNNEKTQGTTNNETNNECKGSQEKESVEKNNNDSDSVIVIEDSESYSKIPEDSEQLNNEVNPDSETNVIDNSSINTPDSILPNNQEGLQNNSNEDKRTSNEGSTSEIPNSNTIEKTETTEKTRRQKSAGKRMLRKDKQLSETTDNNGLLKDNQLTSETSEKRVLKKDKLLTVDTAEKRVLRKDKKLTPETAEQLMVQKDKQLTPETAKIHAVQNDEQLTLETAEKRVLRKDKQLTPETPEKRVLRKDKQLTPETAENVVQTEPLPQETVEKRVVQNDKQLTSEINSVIEIKEKTQEPVIIHSSSESKDSKNHCEVTKEPQKQDKTTETITTTENDEIGTEANAKQNSVSKDNSSEEAGPSALNQESNDSLEKNPCLLNVSLYAEQFTASKYSDSECSEKEKMKRDKTEDKPIESKSKEKTVISKGNSPIKTKDSSVKDKYLNGIDKNDVVVLNSHSESESENENPKPRPKQRKTLSSAAKTQRDIALANVFGFSSGAVSRKRSVSYRGNSKTPHYVKRSRTISKNHTSHNVVSESSGSVSGSDSSPPCCHRDKSNGKYMTPKSYDVLTHAAGGGLFIVGDDKKLYEVVMCDKNTKNHLYVDENADEESDAYWKKKYLEEKLRADELSRKLKHSEERPIPKNVHSSPILKARTSMSVVTDDNPQVQPEHNNYKTELKENVEEPKENNNVKIKFTKDNEIELECQWPNVHPVLEKMAQMFHTNKDKQVEWKTNGTEANHEVVTSKVQVHENRLSVSSGKSTPVSTVTDPDAQARVDKIENEIFKKIEELDKTDDGRASPVISNVTKRRRGRPKRESLSSTSNTVIAKKSKTSSEGDARKSGEGDVRKNGEEPKVPEVDLPSDTASNSKRQTRAPKRFTNESENTVKDKPIVTRSRSTSKQPVANKSEVEIPDDSQVRYKFPPSPTVSRTNSRLSIKNNIQKPSKSYPTKTPRILSSPDNSTTLSIESTQGYQDSDNSPTTFPLKRKRKLSITSQRGKEQMQRKTRTKSYPYLADDDDTLEDNISDKQPSKSATQNSTLDSEAYRSESYQLLLPKTKNNFIKLKKIDEQSPVREVDGNFNTLSPLTINISEFLVPDKGKEGNSSNISLPLSPELSIVENISVSKDMLSSEDHPTINETQANEPTTQDPNNQYMITDVNVSVPLMEQDCELHKSCNITNDVRMTTVSVNTVNMEEPSSSDSLDQKLRDLLLESAKKIAGGIHDSAAKENMEVDPTASEKKKRAKKRCSTPRKKKQPLKSKGPNVDAVIEERTEFCSRGGRQSCPAALNVVDFNFEDNLDLTTENNAVKGKKKKDIIKVKILRPKGKNTLKEKKVTNTAHGNSRLSVNTDSGINDTESGVFFLGNRDSVELIHNHSESCVHANECLGESIEFIENTTKSVYSICSNMSDSRDVTIPDVFCNNAQEATCLNAVTTTQDSDSQSGGMAYYSPPNKSFNSLITEDLSDEMPIQTQPRPSKWYLLSDEETTNTNVENESSPDPNAGCFSANLQQIFPITCAVPDLSTISEMSRENDSNSRKPTLNNNLPSIFD